MSSYVMVEEADGVTRKLTKGERANPDLLPDGARLYSRTPLLSQGWSTTGRSEPYEWRGVRYEWSRYPTMEGINGGSRSVG